jgi:hypothetical protein
MQEYIRTGTSIVRAVGISGLSSLLFLLLAGAFGKTIKRALDRKTGKSVHNRFPEA